ncbi:malate synthase G, partial [Methylocapsa aurea]|uniref:malate synthase G n=1 Tax=Methylocapsa aurea TaxID=663610 RepID=UPI000568EB23
MAYAQVGGIGIAEDLRDFITCEVLAGTGVGASKFWTGLAALIADFTPRIRDQLQIRGELQEKIDQYHRAPASQPFDPAAYESFLRDIGYLEPEPADFTIRTENLDSEISVQAGPQFVVPASNARYVLNAANARWGSLYDALYGSDVIPETDGAERGKSYNKKRGELVIAWVRNFLDETAPLAAGSYKDVIGFCVEEGALLASLQGGQQAGLRHPEQFVGYKGRATQLACALLRNHGLHIEIGIDRKSPIGRDDLAGIANVILESAPSAIIDLEDSVVAVDPRDKVALYRNWLGLMKGSLSARFDKKGRFADRRLASDRGYIGRDGEPMALHGRSLLLVRNVGHHMFSDAVLDAQGRPVPETILDAAITALIAMHDLAPGRALRNSRSGSVYIVKPKLHGPAEAALANDLFGRVEDLLRLPRHTLKMGIMDEERRTTLNLKACIAAAADRVFFINTG